MQGSSDITAARLNLFASVLIFLAAVLPIVYSFLPQIIAKVRGIQYNPSAVSKILRYTSIFLGIVSWLLMFAAGRIRLGLIFLSFQVVFLSIDYVLGEGPAPRGTTFLIVLSWVTVSFLIVMELVLSLFERLIGLH